MALALRVRRAAAAAAAAATASLLRSTNPAFATPSAYSIFTSPPSFTAAAAGPAAPSRAFRTSAILSARKWDDYGSGAADDKIPEDEILFEGCDYKHWLITMEFPQDPKPTPEQMVEAYVQTAAKVLGSVEEAKKKIYACSTTTYQGFQVECDEETSEKFRGLPGVVFILPDSYLYPERREYGGDKYDNGVITPRPPPIIHSSPRRQRFDRNQPNYNRQGNFQRNPQYGNNQSGYSGATQWSGGNYGPQNTYAPPNTYAQPRQDAYAPPRQDVPPNTFAQPGQGYQSTQYGSENTHALPRQDGPPNTYAQPSQGYQPPQYGSGNAFAPRQVANHGQPGAPDQGFGAGAGYGEYNTQGVPYGHGQGQPGAVNNAYGQNHPPPGSPGQWQGRQ